MERGGRSDDVFVFHSAQMAGSVHRSFPTAEFTNLCSEQDNWFHHNHLTRFLSFCVSVGGGGRFFSLLPDIDCTLRFTNFLIFERCYCFSRCSLWTSLNHGSKANGWNSGFDWARTSPICSVLQDKVLALGVSMMGATYTLEPGIFKNKGLLWGILTWISFWIAWNEIVC